MEGLNLRDFKDCGNSQYELPRYRLGSLGLVETEEVNFIDFVKANKEGKNQNGIVTETVLSMLIQHLTNLNVGDLRNRDTSLAITHLEAALFRIENRKKDRKKRGVYGTQKA